MLQIMPKLKVQICILVSIRFLLFLFICDFSGTDAAYFDFFFLLFVFSLTRNDKALMWSLLGKKDIGLYLCPFVL